MGKAPECDHRNETSVDLINCSCNALLDEQGLASLEVLGLDLLSHIIPYPTEFPYGNGMVLHFYQQQESSTTKTVHKVINKRLKTYV